MRLQVIAATTALAVLACGCATSHGNDAGTDARDETGTPCVVAGYSRCDPACGGDSGPWCEYDVNGVNIVCVQGLCLPSGGGEPPYNYDCFPGPDHSSYCRDGTVCVDDPAFGAGECVAEHDCDQAAAEGFPIVCTWSDGTLRVTGAPVETTCPPAPHAATPFCGAPCARCQDVTPLLDRDRTDTTCQGISDRRGLGVCTLFDGCVRGTRGPEDVWGEAGLPEWEELADTTLGCIVLRTGSAADHLTDTGWPTSIEACRAYRDRYPDDVECVVDRDWHPAP